MAAPGFADWLAIADLKARYCRLLDSKDWDGFAALFTEDFLLDASGSGGPVLEGRDVAIGGGRIVQPLAAAGADDPGVCRALTDA